MGGFDRPNQVPDSPAETDSGAPAAPERSDAWLNLDRQGDDELVAFLGLDRTDRAQGTSAKADPEASPAHGQAESHSWPVLREKLVVAEGQAGVGSPDDPLRRQQVLGKELAEGIDKQINRRIDKTLDDLNPKFDPTKSAYSENCTGVVQAYELQRRDVDVQPGPLEKHLRRDEGGPGGRPVSVLEQAWGRTFVAGTQQEIEAAFSDLGARGVVLIKWHPGFGGGRHVFNVEKLAEMCDLLTCSQRRRSMTPLLLRDGYGNEISSAR